MDHPVNGRPLSFAGQIGEFLRRNLYWFLGGALALLLLQDIFGTHGLIAMRRSQQEASHVQREINQLDEENLRLQENVKSLKSDPAAIERIAREEMGLAKPGEYIFKIAPRSGTAPASATPTANSPKTP